MIMASINAKSITVYTAIFGDYDTLRDPGGYNPDCRYLCFSDSWQYSGIWESVGRQRCMSTAVRDARWYKILAHEHIDTEYSIWIDGNLQLLVDPVLLVSKFLADHDLALFVHCERDCVYQEAAANILLRKANDSDIHRQMGKYRAEGYPERNGLAETSILIRRHTDTMREFDKRWWEEIERETHRDQLSFNYVCWKTGMQYNGIPGNFRYGGTSWLRYYVNHEKEIWSLACCVV